MIYRLLHGSVRFLSRVPLPLGRFLGKMLGLVASMIPLTRPAIVLESIRRSFDGTLGEDGARSLLLKVYLHFGQMFFEVPHILKLHRDNLHDYVVFEKEGNLLEAAARGKGVFILTAHFGNWELMSAAISLRYGPGAVVVRPIDFEPLDRIVSMMRSQFGTEAIPKQRAMRRLMSAIRKGKMIGILLDQNVDWYEGAFVKFLGRWACTNKGLALMALKTGTPVIPTFSVRSEDGRYRVVFEREIELVRTGDKVRDVEENTALFTQAIERYVLKYPDQWFWFHRRWKTRNYCPLPEGYPKERQNVQ
ncbi:MAG: lysophospholipid acyltransferase family protein [Deltaproteobacteria bacterium]|nr:lysophospholipid acyltransferase family protein [Deltaproteobacteria bacterium]